MGKTMKQFLKNRGWPEPAIEAMDQIPDGTRENCEKYLHALQNERAQVVVVTGQNNFYKDAIIGTILKSAVSINYIHAPTMDSYPESGSFFYFARFDAPMDFKQAFYVRNQIFKIVSRGGIVFLGVDSIESMSASHTDGFQREYNSLMKVLHVVSTHKTVRSLTL